MNEQLILKIVESVEPQLFWLLLKFIAIGIVLLVIKDRIDGTVAYIAFRLNKRLGLKTRVRVRGIEGEIVDYNFHWIFVKHKDGMELINMQRQRFEKWTLLNGGS